MMLSLSVTSLPAEPVNHDLWDQILQEYVNTSGEVDYAGLKAAPAQLNAYVAFLAATSPESHPARFDTKNDILAYWINAYNAFVLKGIVDAYPITSVKDIGVLNGFFRRQDFTAGGREITLDELENKIIRPQFMDPRIHFVVNCGAVSCPLLENRAFTGANLEARLEAAAARSINDPRYVRLAREESRLYLTKIMEWYGQDFIDWFPQPTDSTPINKPTLRDYIALFLPPSQAQYVRDNPNLVIEFNTYDWSLNSLKDLPKSP
jgi:hypothetical protein